MSRLNLQASQGREPSVHTEVIKGNFLFLQHTNLPSLICHSARFRAVEKESIEGAG